MPFAKRAVEPRRLCRSAGPGADLEDLCAVSNAALSRTVRQLSDLARHAGSLFHELERELAATDRRLRDLRERVRRVDRSTEQLDPKLEAVPVSSLDVESKLSEHFQSAWQLHRNVFVPSSRPPCVEELHLHAKQSLSALHRDQQQRQEVSERERRVTILIAPPTPISPSHHTLHTFESVRSSSPTECCHFSRRSRQVDSDPDSVSLGNRSRFPVPNVPSPLDTQTNWSVALPLPTPEDRMKSQSQAVVSCLVPIDVTGAGFDRDASVRCSLVYSQSVLQRRRKLRRRKTITGIPRQLQQDFDSDESPAASEQPVLVHSSPEDRQENLTPTRLNTRDSGCQTENFFIAVAAPSRRRIRAQRGQSATFPLSHSTGNIPSLPDSSDTMFTTPISSNLRSHSLPRESARLLKEVQINSDNDDEDLSPFEREQFLSVTGENMLKDEEESTDDQVQSERQLGSFNQHPESPEHVWMQRARSHLPCKSDEISSSSDTFSSPIHSNAGVLASQIDHKDDHQSSSGNWSGSSSTCPSQTSETIPPAASPPLTHCDSELSLNTALNITEDSPEPFSGDRLHSLRGHRTGSSASTATDMLDDGGVSTASEADWSYPQHKHNRCCQKDFSPEGSREGEGSLECPSFVSIATMESLDKPPSDKADTMSHFSVDAEGYYTSMHFDCGLKDSKSFAYNYASVDQQKEGYRGHALNKKHSLSLKKPKVKPLPPERCSSLKKISSHARLTPEMSEPKITPEQNLLMSSKDRNSPLATDDHCDQGADEELVEAWAEQVSNQIPDVALLSSTDKQSLKNKEVVQSDYADLWAVNDLKSNDTCRSLSNSSTATGTTVIERMKSKESSEPKSDSRTASPSLPSVETEFRLPSPEKLVNLASPSSGYSSQSETPTSSSAFFPNPNPLSPVGGKRKPKVPERKSSLTSLQRHTSKEDLELPIIPPTHLDLSALHNGKKPLSHRNHIHILNNTVAMPTTESVDPGSSSPLEITPMMLHSVQLRSVSKLGQETRNLSCTDASTKPKRPTMCQLNESRKPSPYKHLTSESPSEDNCEPMFTPTEELEFGSLPSISFTKNRFDRIAPASLWSTSAFSTMSEEVSRDDMTVDISEQIKGPPEQEELFFPQSSMETKKEQEVVLESTEENPQTESLPDHLITLFTRFEKFDQVPDLILHSSVESSEIDPSSSASNHREETASSGGPTRSASQETIGEVSTPDTEDYFSKESTPSDPQVSPLTDESTTEEDSVFLSPTKSRTTEDLFAMIHRSKRKVLGRKDSKGDVAVRSSPSSTSSPATSPSTPVTPTSSQRASSQIYRSVKKSNTSSEEFKQLLLKRGSRSDSSFRISATEILKSPIASRTLSDSLSEGTKHPEGFPSPFQPQSPEKTAEILHSPYPKTAVEGFSSKVFSSSRQGRSRLPPAANSSRYSTRSRHYTTPMQAISEGETENSDGSPHDDRSS